MSNITLLDNIGGEWRVDFIRFSDGAETCKTNFVIHSNITIKVTIEDCMRDLMRIALVKDVLDRNRAHPRMVHLQLDYMPFARADRVFEAGTGLPLAVAAKIINDCDFTTVTIQNPHSDVTPALLKNAVVKSQHTCFKETYWDVNGLVNGNLMICAPDLGATKKVFESVQGCGRTQFVQISKIRDVKTGNIVRCELASPASEIKNKDIIIADDISDGGASFMHAGKLLKEHGARRVFLYVTHAIFPKGVNHLKGFIDGIYADNFIGGYITGDTLDTFNQEAMRSWQNNF